MNIKIITCLLFIGLLGNAGIASAWTEGASNNYFGIASGGSGGSSNSFFGGYAGDVNSGNSNTFIGHSAGYRNTTGSSNTIVGYWAGLDNETGNGNVFLGNLAGSYETGSNKLYIDNSSSSDPLIYGEFDNDFVEINGDLYITGNTYVNSDKNLKKDIKPIESSLNKILGIEGVSYKWKEDRETSDWRHFGVIAQQVEEVLPEVVQKGHDGIRKVAYVELIPVLIEAIKEQQKNDDKQSLTIQKQQEIISSLFEKVKELEQEVKLKDSMAMVDVK